MKKTLPLFLCLALLAACGGAKNPQESGLLPELPSDSPTVFLPENTLTNGLPVSETPTYISCRIIDGAETGVLVLAQLDYPLLEVHPESEGSGPPSVINNGRGCALLTLTEDIEIYLDGAPASASDLEDGMTVEVACCGIGEIDSDDPLTETYIRPISVSAFSQGTVQNLAGTCYDLCGLYLQVLDDLWNKDSGLNDDIAVAGLDLSDAPGGLLDSEKAAIAYCFGQAHGVQVVQGTQEQLIGQGYITVVPDDPECDCIPGPYWQDGCLFSITPNGGHEGEVYFGLPVLFFDAQKWRTPLGAYCFYDCSVIWPEMGTWSGYEIGSEAIA